MQCIIRNNNNKAGEDETGRRRQETGEGEKTIRSGGEEVVGSTSPLTKRKTEERERHVIYNIKIYMYTCMQYSPSYQIRERANFQEFRCFSLGSCTVVIHYNGDTLSPSPY